MPRVQETPYIHVSSVLGLFVLKYYATESESARTIRTIVT